MFEEQVQVCSFCNLWLWESSKDRLSPVQFDKSATKPLIEKRRRARINSSLAQLKEIVAKPAANTQESRSNRLEKADILEMTVEYVKRIHGSVTELSPADHENCFQDGYRLCMNEVQNFFLKNYRKQASKQFLNRSLQNYLQQVFQRTATGDGQSHDRWGCESEGDTPRKNYDFHSETSNYSTDDEMIDHFPSAESNAGRRQPEGSLPNERVLSNESVSKTGLPPLLTGRDDKLHTMDTMWRPW